MAKYEPMTTLSQNIKRLMAQARWTQTDVADACGWTQPDVSKLLSGKANPTLETLELVASIFDVPVYELLTPQQTKKEHAA